MATIPAGRNVYLDSPAAVARQLWVYGSLGRVAGAPVQLTMYGNLIVAGSGAVVLSGDPWLIQFMVTSEAQFVGGGDAPVDSDVGFWVIDQAWVFLQGRAKTPWTRVLRGYVAGEAQLTVQDATGWAVGDELAITPTGPPTVDGFFDRYDVRRISAIAGTLVTLSAPLTYAHPAPSFLTTTDGIAGWPLYTAEVLNLTRSGRIEGRPGLRSHVWIRNTAPPARPQVFQYVGLRYLGPQRLDGSGNLVENLGRYPLHFHRNGDLTRGAIVDGTVVRDFGAHAFVSHDSNGIAYTGNVAHDGFSDAYWWDSRQSGCTTCVEPTGLQFLGNVASRIQSIPAFRGYTLTGFFVGAGDGNLYRGNVAVGVQGNVNASGFEWPELSHGVAVFDRGNLAHDNATDGLFAWQNDSRPHAILNFVAYHNGRAGIEHGAYLNDYLYQDATLYGNLGANLILHALSRDSGPGLRFNRLYSDSARLHQDGVATDTHALPGVQPAFFLASRFENFTRAGIALLSPGAAPDWVSVDAATVFLGNQYWVSSGVPPASLLVDFTQRWYVRRFDQPGLFTPAWNASVTAF